MDELNILKILNWIKVTYYRECGASDCKLAATVYADSTYGHRISAAAARTSQPVNVWIDEDLPPGQIRMVFEGSVAVDFDWARG